jgi:hypothetical protein
LVASIAPIDAHTILLLTSPSAPSSVAELAVTFVWQRLKETPRVQCASGGSPQKLPLMGIAAALDRSVDIEYLGPIDRNNRRRAGSDLWDGNSEG